MSLFTEGGRFRRATNAESEQKRAPKPPITMGMIGDTRVIDNLKRAATLHAEGDPRAYQYHFVGIWPGRGQASIIQEGEIRALMETGMLNLFDGHIAGSGGSGPVFAAHYGLAEAWGDIFAEVNPEIPLFRRGRLMIDELEHVFEERTPQSFPAETKVENIFVSLTHGRTGRGRAVLLDPHDRPTHLLRASMSIPEMAPATDYQGEPAVDGMVADPLPISRILYGPDFPNVNNIIVFLAAPLFETDGKAAALGYVMDALGRSQQIATLLKTQPERTLRETEFITGKRRAQNKRGEPVQIVAIGPLVSSLSPFTLDGQKLARARTLAQEYTTDLLQK